ncbi:MAG: type II secretion system protein GspD, partial [Pseudomonadota bacterium]
MTSFLRRAALVVALASLAVTSGVLAQQGGDDVITTPNFKDVDIRQVIEAVSDVTGQTFLIDARVKGNVTMISDTGMSPDEFYQTFLSILQIYGFVAVQSGNVTKIIPDTNARQFPVPT